MNNTILIFGGIVMSIGITALIIDYFQNKVNHKS